ncbi:MAG: hypothetical protein ACI3ZV_01625 [Paludibacteraceae bacterium]
MATKKTSEEIKREQLAKESMDLVLKRSGVPKKVIIENAMHAFFAGNLDLLTPAERKKYASVIL